MTAKSDSLEYGSEILNIRIHLTEKNIPALSSLMAIILSFMSPECLFQRVLRNYAVAEVSDDKLNPTQ